MIFENCAALLSSARSLSSFLSLQVQYASFLLGGMDGFSHLQGKVREVTRSTGELSK